MTTYLRHYFGLPFLPNGQVWFLWQLLALNFVAAGVYWLAPGAFDALGKWSAAAGRRPVVYFAALLAISAVAYVPLALAFTPWEWSNSGILSVQWCRPLLYGVYFFAGVGSEPQESMSALSLPMGSWDGAGSCGSRLQSDRCFFGWA